MKKIRNIFILMFAVSLGFVSCEDPFAGDDFTTYTVKPMGRYLEDIEDYSSWVELLKKADLHNALNISTDYTCFVASNAAVDRYLKNNGFASIEAMTEEQAWSLAGYHIIPNIALVESILVGKIEEKTVTGDHLDAVVDTDDPNSTKLLDGVRVINFDQTDMINGVVHEVEDVLQPPLGSIGVMLEASDRYTIFTEALRLTGIDAYLKARNVDVNGVSLREFKTVFPVSDSVFNVHGILSIGDLRNRYDGEPYDNRTEFYKFIAYHVLEGTYSHDNLISRETGVEGRNFETYASGEFITIADDENDVLVQVINGHEYQNKIDKVGFELEYGNIRGNNGYIHEVDNLMDVVRPSLYRFVYDFARGPEFESLEFYRGFNTKESKTFTEDCEFVKTRTIPSGTGTFQYKNYGDIWNMPMLNNDWFVVELGEIGAVDFYLPSIMPGEYSLTVARWQYWHSVDYAVDRGEPGTVQAYVNGIPIGEPEDHGDGSRFATKVAGNFTFTKDKGNILSFKIVNPGPLGFDHVILNPIK